MSTQDQGLVGHLDSVDEQRFVGREHEQRLISSLLDSSATVRVLFVSGEGGVGKSTLLRQARRLGIVRGFAPHWFDAEELAASSNALVALLAHLPSSPPPLVLIDTAELLGARVAQLRSALLEALPASARVIMAGRRAPDLGWRSDGWEHLVDVLELGPFDDGDGRRLLAGRGVTDTATVERILSWAQGLPLALAASCETASDALARDVRTMSLATMLLDRVVGPELADHESTALELAAIAPVVDEKMLRAVLDDRDSATTMAWLRSLSFVETRGGRCTLHQRLRRAVVEELRRHDPMREQRLHLHVVDHLHDRAVGGEAALIAELRLLVEDDVLRYGLGDVDGVEVYADDPRPGDAEVLAERLGAVDEPWWPRVRRYFDAAARNVIVIRDRKGTLIGAGIWATSGQLPEWASEDPILSALLAHAAHVGVTKDTVFLLESFDLLGSAEGDVSAVMSSGNIEVQLRSSVPNPRRMYFATTPDDERTRTFMEASGFVAVPELCLEHAGRLYHCQAADYGPGGLIGAVRAHAYRSRGVDPGPPDLERFVRSALRSINDPNALAKNPLCEGLPGDGAIELRAILVKAADETFGTSEREERLHQCLRRGYLDEGASHTTARASLYLSKSAYFRWLDEAISRLSVVVTAALSR